MACYIWRSLTLENFVLVLLSLEALEMFDLAYALEALEVIVGG